MAKNKFAIPEDVLSRIRLRDSACVYCGKQLIHPYAAQNRVDSGTIEHLNFDGPFYWPELQPNDIVFCCGSCNSSRGKKDLNDWFATPYCINKNINAKTVAAPVRSYLRRRKNRNSLRRAV